MVNTVKFSEFDVANINDSTTETVGLSSGVNTREQRIFIWTTGTRPASPFNGLLGLNTSLQQWEWWDSMASAWVQLADTNVLTLLASHAAGEGASLVGLQDQSNVTSKFVQDLANATFIAQTSNGSLQNAQYLGSLTTGIVKNTTVTGVLSISAPLTSIDGLTTIANQFLITTAPDTYGTLGALTDGQLIIGATGSAPALATLTAGSGVSIVSAAGSITISATGTGGTVTSISAGTGITLTPNPITTTGSVALTVPVTEILGGTNQTTYTLGDILYSSAANTLSKLAGNTTAVKQYLSQTGTGAVSAAPAWATIDGGDITGAALTKTDDTNVTLTLGGSPTTALLRATSLTLGWAGQLSLARGGTNANLTASNGGIFYSTATAGAILAGTATANLPLLSGASSAPSWGAFALSLGGALTTAGALTTVGAFDATFTFTGITSVTFPTSGTLATTAQIPTGAALTKTDDTNVTLTLGGSPTTALVNAASLTLGWTGELSLGRGGTNANLTASNGGIFYSTATAGAILAGTATARQMLQSGASGAPAWSTATWPATTTANQILFSSATNVVGEITTGNNGVLITSAGGVPSISSTLPAAVQGNITTLGTITSGIWNGTTIAVANGGTGNTTFTAYSVICAGTTATGAFQNVSGVGASGQVLTSNGAATLPTWQNVTGTGTVNSGTAGQLAYYATTGTAVSGGQLGNIAGTATNDDAASGNCGQVLSSVVTAASPVTFTTSGTTQNLTSISVPAGDWDCWANIGFSQNSVGFTLVIAYISTATAGTLPDASLYNSMFISAASGMSSIGIQAPYKRLSLSTTTTIYLVARADYTAGTTTMYGGIYLRRAR